ncbi:hypothetical protein MesoLj131c_62690 [Mesorhizobium sp. 131-3-5]|uniref:hypothetical protein n=1 Tax=Mesorhizobium sp. 131-3-5 TaxID=2744520 RepID=UPI00192732BB|nr:hypothetical protein [Mesorhizobium sp. 131-3-5]BCH12011.1 hypothetical protein MesoLj131c_62690 [Mesorhizobium sp. 131-3-5]
MSAAFLFLGAIILLGAVAHRAYIEITGNGMAVETSVLLIWIASLGAFLIVCGALLGAL